MSAVKLAGLNPASVFDFFEEICAIPHGSRNTKAISDYLVDFAKSRGLRYFQDDVNNVVIFQDGTCGYENHEPVILQGHMDMVCEKDASCPLDMAVMMNMYLPRVPHWVLTMASPLLMRWHCWMIPPFPIPLWKWSSPSMRKSACWAQLPLIFPS